MIFPSLAPPLSPPCMTSSIRGNSSLDHLRPLVPASSGSCHARPHPQILHSATAAHRPYSSASLSLIRFQLLRALPAPQSQPPHQSQQVSAASPLFFNIDPYFPSLDHCPSPLHSHTSLALEGASPAIPGTLLGPLGHCSQCPQHITKIATTCHMLDLILRTLQEETHLFLVAIPGVRSYFHYHFTDGKVPGTE